MFKFLSGSGGAKKEESKKKANALGIDPALFEDPKFDDMEDPQMDMPQETVDVSALISEVDNDAPIEVTDDDMNDPELLAELNEISDPSSEDKLNMIQSLREQVALEKKKALALNSKGDKEGARKALTNAKTLQGQLDQLTGSHAAASAPTPAATAAPVTSAPAPTPVAAKPAPVRAPATAKPVKIEDEDMEDDDAPVDSKQATELRNRIKVYTAAALTHKQAGINIFKKALEEADMGFPVDMKSLPPATPAPVSDDGDDVPVATSPGGVQRSTAPAMTVMTAAQREAQQRKQTLDTLLGELAKTVEAHKNAALAAKSAGDMTGARQSLGHMKEAQSQQVSLQAALNDPSIPLPAHHFEVKETKTEVAFANLAPHDMEITILNIKDLRPPSGYTNLSLYVYAEVQFNEKDSVQKIQTPTINNSLAPVYNHTSKLMIDRNKSFLRYVEKRKITFQVYHSKFLGNLQIGKAEMKISDLTDKAEIQEDIPIIKDGTRRPVGGTLSVRIRLKTPLVKKDVRITRETILVIDGAFPTAAPPIASPVSTPTKTTPATSPSSTPTPTPKTPTPQASAKPPATSSPAAAPVTATSSESTPAPSSAKVPAQPAPAQEDEMDLEDVNNVDNIISNDVLENEITMVDAQIAQYLQKKQPVPEALTDRKQGLELKMNILIMQVQTGAITPEKYIDMLKAKVDQEMALAKKLVTIGKKDWAKYPLTRAKIMKNEIESASAEDDE